eukprot:GFYU01003596.1.p1 GENE.GFYU01003596.1~~GFYU01003596.1.p1  ORF type:complete len:1677 (-),score=380.96 GFYU01003596.1:129-5090(-)
MMAYTMESRNSLFFLVVLCMVVVGSGAPASAKDIAHVVERSEGIDVSNYEGGENGGVKPHPIIPVYSLSPKPRCGPLSGGTITTIMLPPGFAMQPNCTCQFGGHKAAAMSTTGQTVTCISPPLNGILPPGPVALTLNTSPGANSTDPSEIMLTVEFVFYDKITLTSIDPATGPANGGTLVTVSSPGIVADESVLCKFSIPGQSDGIKVSGWIHTLTSSVLCQTPALEQAMPLRVFIAVNGQQFSDSSVLFTYFDRINITKVTPDKGLVLGGTLVTVYGQNFIAGSEDAKVRFDGTLQATSDVTDGPVAFVSMVSGRNGELWILYKKTDDGSLCLTKCYDIECDHLDTLLVDRQCGENGCSNSLIVVDNVARMVYSAQRSLFFAYTDANGGVTSVQLGVDGDQNQNPSIAVDSQGLPVIAYYDGSSSSLKVLKCFHKLCAGDHFSVVVVDRIEAASVGVGIHNALIVGSDGLPLLVYDTFTNNCTKVAPRPRPSGRVPSRPKNNGDGDNYDGIYGDDDNNGEGGFPSVNDLIVGVCRQVKIAHCLNDTCTAYKTNVADEMQGITEGGFSMAIGADGRPIFSYFYSDFYSDVKPEGYLKIGHCLEATCWQPKVTTVDQRSHYVGVFNSIAISNEGLPVVAYYEGRAHRILVAFCGDLSCHKATFASVSSNSTSRVVDFFDIVIPRAAGTPVIAYFDSQSSSLKLSHCITSRDMPNRCPRYVQATVLTDTQLVVVTPPAADDTTVKASLAMDGQQYLDEAFKFDYYNLQAVQLQPKGGPIAGGTEISLSVLSEHSHFDATPFEMFFSRWSSALNGVDVSEHLIVANSLGEAIIIYIADSRRSVLMSVCKKYNACTPRDSDLITSTFNDMSGLSLKINQDDFPVITFVSTEASRRGTLYLLECLDRYCTEEPVRTTVDHYARGASSVSIHPQGYPIISYFQCVMDDMSPDCVTGGLMYAKCFRGAMNETQCAERMLMPGIDVGEYSEIGVSSDDCPIIVFLDRSQDNGSLKMAHCHDQDCSDVFGVITVSEAMAKPSPMPCARIGRSADGHPVIALIDMISQARLQVLVCADPHCHNATHSVLDNVGTPVHCGLAMEIMDTGKPIITYEVSYDGIHSNLRLIECTSDVCDAYIKESNFLPRTIVDAAFPSIAVEAGGLGLMTYLSANKVNLLQCVRVRGCSLVQEGTMMEANIGSMKAPPSVGPRESPMYLSFNNQQFSNIFIDYIYYNFTIHAMEPTTGFATGGTEVMIHGRGLVELNTTLVRFGQSGPAVLGHVTNRGNSIVVTAPEMVKTGDVELWVSLNGQEYQRTNLFFAYTENPVLIELAIIIGCSFIAALMLIIVVGRYIRKRHRETRGSSYASLTSPLLVPDECMMRLEDLQLTHQIGGGSYSEVWCCNWRGTCVAVKKLYTENLDREAMKEFELECSIMSKLRHPNVVLFIGFVSEPPCLVTEYCSRGTVYDLIHSPLPLSWERVISFAVDTCRGMHYLHSFNPQLIHRDLKTPNLLVDDAWNVKVGDFGLSRFKNDTYMTTVGTPGWAAPEVLRNQHYSEKADVYSFGIVLWELCSRQPLYPDMAPHDIIREVCERQMRPPSINCPKPLNDLMLRCLSEDPEKRPSFSRCLEMLQRMNWNLWDRHHSFRTLQPNAANAVQPTHMRQV